MRPLLELRTIVGASCAILFVACSGSSEPAPAPATVSPAIHVDSDAPDGGDGASWASALNDLHAAVDVARSGDEIWVAEGTYRPAPPDGDRLASFVLKS